MTKNQMFVAYYNMNAYNRADAVNNDIWGDRLTFKLNVGMMAVIITVILSLVWMTASDRYNASQSARQIAKVGKLHITSIQSDILGTHFRLKTNAGVVEIDNSHPLGTYISNAYWSNISTLDYLPLDVQVRYTNVPQQSYPTMYPHPDYNGYYLAVDTLPIGDIASVYVHPQDTEKIWENHIRVK